MTSFLHLINKQKSNSFSTVPFLQVPHLNWKFIFALTGEVGIITVF